ncbi:MAG: EAL domain-containing protein [Actinobacteria bacterium]|nr:EAL domain-containing protein [Actinomycetota bacterium]
MPSTDDRAWLLDALPDVVLVVDADAVIRDVAGDVELLLAWPRDRLVGRSSFELFAKQGNRPLHETAFAEVVGRPGISGPMAATVYGGDGSVREVELVVNNRLAEPEGALVVSLRDITRRVGPGQHDVESLRRREAWADALLRQTADVIIVTDRRGHIVYLNPNAAAVLGRPVSELEGCPLSSLLTEEDRHSLGGEALEALITSGGGGEPLLLRVERADGAQRVLRAVLADRPGDPAVAGVVISATDVTDGFLAEDLLAETAHLVEGVARGEDLRSTIRRVAEAAESRLRDARVVVGIARSEGDGAVHIGPSLPISALQLFDRTDRVVTGGALGHVPVRELGPPGDEGVEALADLGLRSCWAVPVVSSHGAVTGSLAALHPGDRPPTGAERSLLERYANVMALAVERRDLERELAYRASYDQLTGLPNRAEILTRMCERGADRPGVLLAVVFVDLDRFKLVNDTLGHAAGDELLRAVAGRFRRTVRPRDVVARFGGDEFVVLCDDVHDREGATALAGRLAGALEEPVHIGGSTVVVTASMGIAVGSADVAAETLLRDADLAMYEAKARGRNATAVFEEDLRERAQRRLQVENDLREGLRDAGFALHYQPQIRLTDGVVVGVEALLRWRIHGRRASPAELIPVAEDSGLIIPLGAWVIDEATAAARRFLDAGRALVVTVNVSARQLAHRELFDVVVAALDRNRLPGAHLCLEVTESDLVHDTDTSVEALARLKELDVELAIDDFGTGYATLDYVRRFGMADVLKIDGSFMSGLADPDGKDRAIVSAALVLGRALDFRTVAEGVETPAQRAVLEELGCDGAQGFLLSPPVPERDLSAALAALDPA